MFGLWMTAAGDTALLGLEAMDVVGLRLMQIALGRGTPAETQLMVTEKMLAFMEASATVASGGSFQTVVDGYRRQVQANAARLKQE